MSSESSLLNSNSSFLQLVFNKSDFKINVKSADVEKASILFMETDKKLLAYLNKELKSQYLILQASTIAEAIHILSHNEVNLVITEIMIPDLEGIQLCRQIKSDPSICHIPVLFLAPQKSLEIKIQVLNDGADAYIEKPFSIEFLKAQIENLLLNRQNLKNYFTKTSNPCLNYYSNDNFPNKLLAIIEENISEKEVTVDRIAKQMNVSRPTLYRKICQFSKLKPKEMIKLAKLQKAAELLLLKKFSVSQIAAMVGYSEQSNFSRDFFKHFGKRPGSYSTELEVEKSFAC